MRIILESCVPRPDILGGSFNPEIFTASLSQVMDAYRGRSGITHNLYTDGELFFREATYPTEGIKTVLAEVFGRLAGDQSLPAIHRLETAFGGGKTHTLIALTHLGERGRDLSAGVADLIDPALLPAAGEVRVVGIAGDEIPVHKPQGVALVPYTLWGEIAFQVGGEALYRQVEVEATSLAAPGKNFFETVFSGRKVLLMLDELAQYAARLTAAHPDGSDQLAAFLMGLHGYARTHGGIAVVLTLASKADAFGGQTQKIVELLTKVRGQPISPEDAMGLAQHAETGVRSVVARDAITVVPVQAAEISRVLAKRLFVQIDRQAAAEVAAAYADMYQKSAANLPEYALRDDFRQAMVEHYPFHPTFIAFLNQKLATVENFQGTRGVLRVLSLAVRSIWNKQRRLPMIHTCHLDLREARTVNEIVGRTGSGDLLAVLNTDIGGPDSGTLAAARSRAEIADLDNPHPEGHPLYEYSWKTVFLHSLVGRGEGLGSNLFGITEKDALFEVAFPGMTPPQVETALREIENGAYYLRYHQGRYYASLDPSVNRALASIRESLRFDQVKEVLVATTRKVVTGGAATFSVVHDVSAPEHVSDKGDKPQLALIDLDADDVDVEAFVTTVGVNRPRRHQNLVFLLLPRTVHVKGEVWNEDRVRRAREAHNRLEEMARDVLARRKLKEQPEHHGIATSKLAEQDFERKLRERDIALVTTVTQMYDGLWFPNATGQVVRKEIKSGAGEGGLSVLEEIRRVLRTEGELVTPEQALTQEALLSLAKLFFDQAQTPTVDKLRENFACNRRWPVLDDPAVLDQVVRAGVGRGLWCLFRMAGPDSVKPEEFFCRDTGDLPFSLDLTEAGWALVTPAGATQRGWMGQTAVDPTKVQQWVVTAIADEEAAYVKDIVQAVTEQHGDVPEKAVLDAIDKLVQNDRLMAFTGQPSQQEKPLGLLHGSSSILHSVNKEEALITPAGASRRGWVSVQRSIFRLEGRQGAQHLYGLLPRLGSLYARGAKSTIRTFDLTDLEIPGGGTLRLALENVAPEGMKQLGELFEVLAHAVQQGPQTDGFLEIDDPSDDCAFIKTLKEEK